MSRKSNTPAAAKRQPRFAAVPTRARHDGWTATRQVAFIEALAASACVEEAARTVGLSASSAYRLRARPDAQPFRLAWDAALDYGVRRLSDAVLARALHGEPIPHFYKGEQVGEHRRYDNRLAQFLLRYRDPLRYAATLDQMVFTGDQEIASLRLAGCLARLEAEGAALPPPVTTTPWRAEVAPSPAEIRDEAARRDAAAAEADRLAREERNRVEYEACYASLMELLDSQPEDASTPDVA